MAHFAKIVDGIVTEVIVAEQDFIDDHCTGTWIQTSYNTRGGKHYEPNSNLTIEDSGTPLRGNFAGIGMVYDSENDKFYEPKPHESWILDKNIWSYEPPIPYPSTFDGGTPEYVWDEDLYQSDNSKGWIANSS